jgi:hypothetical protein
VTAPYDHDALWTKAKVFLNRAMDPDPGRSFDEQALYDHELVAAQPSARATPGPLGPGPEPGAGDGQDVITRQMAGTHRQLVSAWRSPAATAGRGTDCRRHDHEA